MLKDVKVAAIQYEIPKNHIEGEKKITRFVEDAVSHQVEIVGLPEECLASMTEIKSGYDPFNFLSDLAKQFKIFLFGANAANENDGKIYTIGFLIDPNGPFVIKQKKIVLTPPAIESGFSAGESINVVDTKFGRIAILICKDSFHRYSGWFFEELRKVNVDIVLIPSSSISVSERSVNLWTDTIKTMSMLFNVFIIAPGTVGINGFDDSQAFGHALIVSPQTVVLAEGSPDKEEILYASLPKEHLERLRSPEAAKWQPSEVPQFKINLYENKN